jgi:uncharacterized membrane protein
VGEETMTMRDRMPTAAETQHPTTHINVAPTERLVSLVSGGALAVLGLTRRNVPGLAMSAVAGELLYRGITGHCPVYEALGINTAITGWSDMVSVPHGQGMKIKKSATINRSPEELYAFWRNFENLPRFMEHLESVRVLDDKRSHWVAKGPAGITVEWDAEIINEVPNEVIGWRSLENSQVDNAGSVRFERAPGNRGTVVEVTLNYAPPAGKVGAAIAKLLGEDPEQQISEDLQRFKQLMEAGEIPTTEGQPSGRGRKK